MGDSLDTNSLGANIRKCRLRNNMTQETVAELCNLSANYIRQIELGYKIPKLDTFLKIANALDVSADTLLAESLSRKTEIRNMELFERISQLPKAKQECLLRLFNQLTEEIDAL
jgi:transcriptional regulator with XRE-family HTH domain